MKEAKQFYTHEAIAYGVDKAILINYLRLFIMGNKARSQHEYEGRTYTYATHQEIANRHPFWSKKKVSRMVSSLVDAGVIVVGYFAENPWDRTSFYAFVDEDVFLFPDKDKRGTSDVDTSETSHVDTGETSSYAEDKLKSTKVATIGDLAFKEVTSYFDEWGFTAAESERLARGFIDYNADGKAKDWKRRAATWKNRAIDYGEVRNHGEAKEEHEVRDEQLGTIDTSKWKKTKRGYFLR